MNKSNLLVGIQFVIFACIGIALILLPISSTAPLQLVGVALAVAGISIALAAIREHHVANKALPRVSPEPNRQVQLVRSGLYQGIRHPIYTGVIASAFGAALAHGHWLLLGLAAVLWLFFEYKSRHEEQLLTKIYADYPQYMQQAGRFLPRIG